MTDILMPALSPTMEEGTLAKWHVKPGDTVTSGDVIAEIETDKATMEVEAVDEGTLAKIVVPEGTQDVAVNQVIAVLANEGEDVARFDGFALAFHPFGEVAFFHRGRERGHENLDRHKGYLVSLAFAALRPTRWVEAVALSIFLV